MPSPAPIPMVLRIDVEPEEHQPAAGERPWNGFLAMSDMIETLRQRLGDVTGHPVRPTWLIRLDPDIERAFGRTDFALRRHQDVFNQILKHDDALGIHVHALRWNTKKGVVFSDHADEAWCTECLRVAASTFQSCFGAPPRVVSFGGGFMRNSVLDAAVDLGVKADVTVEPGLAAKHQDPSFGAYSTAPSGDFLRCPRLPYYPSRTAFDTPATSAEDVRPLLMVPLTSCDPRPTLKRWYRRLMGSGRPGYEPLNPWKIWPSPQRFWGLARRTADELPAPYLAFALRTDAPNTDSYRRVSGLFDHLPRHPIAKRLRIVGPLSPEVESLAGPRLFEWPATLPGLNFNERDDGCGNFFNQPPAQRVHSSSQPPHRNGTQPRRKQ
jgi:hypothetical protein